MSKWWKKIKNEIVDTKLYSRSGVEVGVSNGTLKLVEKNGDYFPIRIKKNVPAISYYANPDLVANYPKLNQSTFGKLPDNWLIGNYMKIFIGYHQSSEIRRNGSSAGIISGIQIYMIEKSLVDGVITLRMRKDKPYLTEPIITNKRREILNSSQSKYITAPVNQILSDLPGKYKSICYTGLPHEIVSIRKLQKKKHPSVKGIKYVLGLFYGETIGFSAIESFAKANDITDLNQITRLAFREGDWPGNMVMELKNGNIIKVPKFHANYLIPSHITPFSLYQVDYTSELADISVGDAWSPKYEERGKGWSVVIARNKKGLDLLNKMQSDKKIWLKEITVEELIKMHSHGLDLKKRGAFIRIEKRRKKGLSIPEYGYRPINIPAKRIAFEYFLGFLFIVFRSRIIIRVLETLPTPVIGWFFVLARNFWKKFTKPTKKSGLFDLKFEVVS